MKKKFATASLEYNEGPAKTEKALDPDVEKLKENMSEIHHSVKNISSLLDRLTEVALEDLDKLRKIKII